MAMITALLLPGPIFSVLINPVRDHSTKETAPKQRLQRRAMHVSFGEVTIASPGSPMQAAPSHRRAYDRRKPIE